MNKLFAFTERQDIKGVDNLELMKLFLQQVEHYPNQPAVITTERTLSYIELAEQAQSLAGHLLQMGVKNEMPVAIFMKSGIEQVICQVAILLSGGSCVPLNVASPDNRLNFMLQEAKVIFTLTDSALAGRALSTRYVLLDAYPRQNVLSTDLPGIKAGLNHRAYIMFTSGTTGTPKAVEVEYRGILRLVVNADYLPISTLDRLGSISAPDFDAILLEVWGALLNGAATVIIDREVLLDPEALKSCFIDYAVSSILVTPSLFNFITTLCPDTFRTLSYLMIGGEAFNIRTLRALPLEAWPKNIYNVYGPTENTTYTLYYPIGLDDLTAESMPLGKPINKTEVFILDDQLQLADVGVLGEIYVGGDGVARGYLNRPELTAEKFITIKISGEDELKRLYKTGDLGWKRADGVFMYSGRVDNQIKLQGYRIEAEEVETQLLKTGLLLEAIVCAVKKEGDEGYLLAFVVPQDPSTFNSKQLLGELKQCLPPYMLPRIHMVGAIPWNPNGKADRPKLLELYKQQRSSGKI
ncbi:amino acid adenylation domain-containing protein [Serratia ficaria]|uniref:amino acid adenylation domain-containing protein n=1 Tax=Serratia ficaria TaxID=61651 RepID=UPI00217A755B|nr:amino acid adenylation domain-containing protein [Serratia ficaria]CAI1747635.1 Tyrocidine synthase III [Serratia ficaria]